MNLIESEATGMMISVQEAKELRAVDIYIYLE